MAIDYRDLSVQIYDLVREHIVDPNFTATVNVRPTKVSTKRDMLNIEFSVAIGMIAVKIEEDC